MINGQKIREIRQDKGFTTYDLSVRTHVSKSYIEEIERGDKKNPSFQVIEKICDGLNVTIEEVRLKGAC